MKVSSVLIIVGMVLVLLGLALPANFAIISAEPSNTSQYVTLSSTTPSSTTSSSPTYLPYSSVGTETVSACWTVSDSYEAYCVPTHTVSLANSTNQVDYGLLGSSLSVSTGNLVSSITISSKPVVVGSCHYDVYISGNVKLTKTVPMTVNTNYAFYFNFTGTFTVNNTKFSVSTFNLYGGTPLVYGEMQSTLLNNGQFYMDINGTYTKITPTSSISLFPSEFPFTFPVWYVENNGTPQNEGSVYLQVNGGPQIEYNLNATPQSITGYKAWEVNVTFLSQGKYTVDGYAEDSITSHPVLLMSIVYNGNTTTTTTLKLGVTNYDIIGIGVVVVLVGIIGTRFRF
jgi:hypothetical protein